jgi:hypothetical protein
MRTVSKYLQLAAEFDEMVKATSSPSLIKRFAYLADCYWRLGSERQQLLERLKSIRNLRKRRCRLAALGAIRR